MKILNLYAGIGGNRKLWGDEHEITAVELNEKIAGIYKDFYPKDTMIVTDAHEYLRKNFKDYDFIWASPPCPTHSRFNFLNNVRNKKIKYPEMSLYQEIILLKTWFKGQWCIENVISYYDPLLPPIESGSHYFWTNFVFTKRPNVKRGIRGEEHDYRLNTVEYDLSKYELSKAFEKKIINNCVEPETGLEILNCAMGVMTNKNISQGNLF